MNNLLANKKSLVLSALIVVSSIGLLSGCGEAKSQAKEEKVVALVPVQVDPVIIGDIDAAYGSTAVLEAAEESEVTARQAGIVVNIKVEEGDYVEAGQVLAQLETEQLSLELKRAEANLNQLSNELKRQERIYQKNLVSSEAYERVKFEFQAQKAQTDLAKLNLEHATIRAPISGIVANRYIKVGNMLTTNQAAFHITNMSELHAVIHLPESEKAELKPDQLAYIKVASQEAPFVGHIERISPIVDRNTGTIRVTVSVSPEQGLLRPGMFGRVGVIYDSHKSALLIPKQAVVTQDKEAYVYTVVDGKAHKSMVQTGFIDDDNIEILEGVKQHDLVITMGHRNLKDQTEVEVIEAVADL